MRRDGMGKRDAAQRMLKDSLLKGDAAGARAALAAGADPDGDEEDLWLPFVSGKGYIKCVRVLLEAGADPNKKNRGGWTGGHSAASSGEESVLRELLAAGLQVNGWTHSDSKQMGHLAALRGHAGCLRMLLEHGWDPRKSEMEANALNVAVWGGHEECARLLLGAGMDPNQGEDRGVQMSHRGWTAGHFAVAAGREGMLRLLLESGLDWRTRVGGGGVTLENLARSRGHEACARMLKERRIASEEAERLAAAVEAKRGEAGRKPGL